MVEPARSEAAPPRRASAARPASFVFGETALGEALSVRIASCASLYMVRERHSPCRRPYAVIAASDRATKTPDVPCAESSAWDAHLASEFTAKSPEQALATPALAPDPSVVRRCRRRSFSASGEGTPRRRIRRRAAIATDNKER